MDIASPMLPTAEGTEDSTGCFALDNTALTELVAFQKKHNPRLKGKSNRDIAEACGITENTLCAILKGKNPNPRIGTLVYLIRIIGGGSIDRLVGFAPPRDYAKEEATYDATIAETLQARLDEKRETIENLKAQIADLKAQAADSDKRLVNLRTIIHEEGKAGNSAQGQLKEMEMRLADKREQIERNQRIIDEQIIELRRLRRWNNVLIAALVAMTVALAMLYLAWEIRNPDQGLTGLLRELMA